MNIEPSTSISSEEELKEYLEEAGLYEENMSLREMLSYYNAIRSSKNTAQQEDEQRSILESTDKNCKLLEELKENVNLTLSKLLQTPPQKKTDDPEEDVMVTSTPSKTTVKETLKKAVDEEEEEGEEAEVFWDVFDCPLLKHKPLDIVTHKPKYHLPIHCDPEILKLPFETRTKYIYNFHRILLDKFYKLHCESLNPAPWGKPIQENPKFNNASLDRKAIVNSEEHEVEEFLIAGNSLETSTTTEIYTSRAAARLKRKVYVENEEEKSKKSKRDEDNDFQIHTTKPVKRPALSKLSNAEIMKRSKLFASESPKASRSDTIFNQLHEEDKKTRQSQKAMENFKSTLPSGSDDEDEGETDRNSQETRKEVEIKPQPMSFLRRKSPASPHRRKPIRKSVTSERGKGRLTKTNSRSKSQETLSDNSAELQDVFLEEAAGWGEGKARCPICSEVFSQDIIEEHASSCGLGMDTESNFGNVPRGSQEMIKCTICNKEMLFNMNYEVHLKECVAKTTSRSSSVS